MYLCILEGKLMAMESLITSEVTITHFVNRHIVHVHKYIYLPIFPHSTVAVHITTHILLYTEYNIYLLNINANPPECVLYFSSDVVNIYNG